MQAETDEKPKLCQHRDAQVSFGQRDLTDAARRAARAREGSAAHTRAIRDIQTAKESVAETRRFIEAEGPICAFCVEQGRVPTT